MREAENGYSGMDSVFSGFVLDPSKCSQLSLGEKRELVHEIAQWAKDAPKILSSFTRRELLQIICAEMGKERKYSGYNKHKMIEHLLSLISQKPKRSGTDNFHSFSQERPEKGAKRKRLNDPPVQLNHAPLASEKESDAKTQFCQNVACRASLVPDLAFCRRCSCCICHQFDDNKDPSLWLTCGSDSLDENDSCGMSCHLKCALTNERAGCTKLDGSYFCVSCGKINRLMRTWRKQLLVAKEARRVDVLCLRISLAHEILVGSEKYKELHKTVEAALNILKNEAGPLNLLCTKMARGIVNRLSRGAEIQKLCASAVEAFDSMVNEPCLSHTERPLNGQTCQIRFLELSATSVIIVLDYVHNLFEDFLGCRVWHRESTEDYPDNPTFIVLRPQKRFRLANLNPSTEYFCKVSLFSSKGSLGVWEASWVSPASNGSCSEDSDEKEGTTIIAQMSTHVKSNLSGNKFGSGQHDEKPLSLDDTNRCKNEGFCSTPCSESVSPLSRASLSPSTPRKSYKVRKESHPGCEKRQEESDYEYSVRVVKWLEHQGHITEDFRVKFLTWFSLKATLQKRRVVNVFVDALIDDPPSLAGQLKHTFMDEICCEQKPGSGYGFCTRLWH